MESIIFSTNNQHKVDEIKTIVGDLYHIITLKDAGIEIDIPEPHDTLEANAREKSKTIFALTGKNCFGEDTGLEVEGLNGEPGVKSARYAGDGRNFSDNVKKLLSNLHNSKNRNARFRTVISLMLNGKEYLFEGVCEGTICEAPSGEGGFGYDPVFIPQGANITFADMSIEEKNFYSHRQKATSKLISFLSQNRKTTSLY
jgi:XTP/dITP diphosphohydrolase